jgi:hypothetical protein
VGWQGDPKFKPATFDLVHTSSGGIPRRINTLCNRLLLAGYLGEKHEFDVPDVQAIVHEIHDELGPDRSSASAMARRLREAEELMQDAPRANGSPGMAGNMEWASQLRTIEGRIDRLEKTMSTAVDLLQRVLSGDRGAKPGSAKH